MERKTAPLQAEERRFGGSVRDPGRLGMQSIADPRDNDTEKKKTRSREIKDEVVRPKSQ